MSKDDEYLEYATDCQRMAGRARTEQEKVAWLNLARAWLDLKGQRPSTSLSLEPVYGHAS